MQPRRQAMAGEEAAEPVPWRATANEGPCAVLAILVICWYIECQKCEVGVSWGLLDRVLCIAEPHASLVVKEETEVQWPSGRTLGVPSDFFNAPSQRR